MATSSSMGRGRGRINPNCKPNERREPLGPYQSDLISLDDSPIPESLMIPQPASKYTCFGTLTGPEAEKARARSEEESIRSVEGAHGGEEKMRSSVNVSAGPAGPKSNLQKLRTPMEMLNEVCGHVAAKIYYPVEEEIPGKPGSHLFRCEVLVVTRFNDTYNGYGLGTSKKNAKQAAARNVLMEMAPDINTELCPLIEGQMPGAGAPTPSDRSSVHVAGQLQEGSRQQVQHGPESGMVPYVGGAGVGSATAEGPEEEEEIDREEEVHVNTTVEGEITITLRLPQFMTANKQKTDQGVQTQTENLLKEVTVPDPAKKLSLIDQVKAVQEWEGPKILKLKGFKVDEIKDPIKVVGTITAEQKLKMEQITLSEENGGDDGMTKYTCLLEVYELPDLERSVLHFTEFGTGDSPVDAQQAAARKFLEMIRMILNSC